MKKYVLGLIILSFISLSTYISHQYTNYAYKDSISSINTICNFINDDRYKDALKETKALQESFKTKNKILSIYTSHIKLDEITASISRLTAYVENENKNDSLAELNAIRTRLKIIYDEEEIGLENIL